MVGADKTPQITNQGVLLGVISPISIIFISQVTWYMAVPGEEGVTTFLTSHYGPIDVDGSDGYLFSCLIPLSDSALLHLPQVGTYLVKVCGGGFILHVLG